MHMFRTVSLCVSRVASRLYSQELVQKPKLNLIKPAVFTIIVGSGSYISSVVFNNSRSLRSANYYHKDGVISNSDIIRKVRYWWKSLRYDQKFLYSVIGINSLVYLLWRIPRAAATMHKYFLSAPVSRTSLPLLLCTFSHMELWHLGVNMIVLWSFTPVVCSLVGPEQLWPFFLTGGTFAAMVGHYVKITRGTLAVASLGASGALMAMASFSVLNYPDASLYIIFLPFIPIPANLGLAGVVLLDIVGLVRGWKLFDHGGHLGGFLFGLLYYKWLHSIAAEKKQVVLQRWKKLKSLLK